MILVQLTKDGFDSISDLVFNEIQYFVKTGAPGLAQKWQDISSRFNPIASDVATVLWSPLCPFCIAEMALEENIPDQTEEMTVRWACDRCDTVMELRTYHRTEVEDE